MSRRARLAAFLTAVLTLQPHLYKYSRYVYYAASMHTNSCWCAQHVTCTHSDCVHFMNSAACFSRYMSLLSKSSLSYSMRLWGRVGCRLYPTYKCSFALYMLCSCMLCFATRSKMQLRHFNHFNGIEGLVSRKCVYVFNFITTEVYDERSVWLSKPYT